jgi:hypothetical protein
MAIDLSCPDTLDLIQFAARRLTGQRRRAYQAKVVAEYLGGHARRAETLFGWGRATVTLGLHERRSGCVCRERFAARGRQTTEARLPNLAADIQRLVEPHGQADPQFQSSLVYTRLSARRVRQALLETGRYREEQLPRVRTFSALLNRLGYRLRSVQKCRPLKKIPQTDAIFANVRAVNAAATADPHTLRLSVDCKATVAVGHYSRGGQARGQEPVRALDHDMGVQTKLVPCGVLEPRTGELTVALGQSAKTSDFVADTIEQVCRQKQAAQPPLRQVVLNLDNGPESSGQRSQFLLRMVQLADALGLLIHLVYYPPYHSKYNPIERCWGVLERFWNGALLSTVPIVLQWCRRMTWKGLCPVVELSEKVYPKGVRLQGAAKAALEQRLQRSKTLPKWDILIEPLPKPISMPLVN